MDNLGFSPKNIIWGDKLSLRKKSVRQFNQLSEYEKKEIDNFFTEVRNKIPWFHNVHSKVDDNGCLFLHAEVYIPGREDRVPVTVLLDDFFNVYVDDTPDEFYLDQQIHVATVFRIRDCTKPLIERMIRNAGRYIENNRE